MVKRIVLVTNFVFFYFTTAAVFGCLTMGLAFLSLTLGTLVSIIMSVIGVFGAPILSAFAMGMLWKRIVPR